MFFDVFMEENQKNDFKQLVLELLNPLTIKLDQLSLDVTELKTSLITRDILNQELGIQKNEIQADISKNNEKIISLETDLKRQKNLIKSLQESLDGFLAPTVPVFTAPVVKKS